MIQPVKEKIILGIDPGTTIMGYGVLRVKGTKPEMIAMGIIDLRKFANHYLKLRHIHERVLSIIESYLPDELAIEAPFFGKNVQSMLKLGRAQGVAMAANVGMSRVHMHRKLKELTNQSARDFIRSIRLKQAANLLREKNLSVSEVAYATGFSNLSHFSNTFRDFY